MQENGDVPLEVRLKQVLSYSLDFVKEQCELLSAINAPNCEDDRTLIYQSSIYQTRHELYRKLLEEIPKQHQSSAFDAIYTADLIMAGMAPSLYQFLREDRGYLKEEIQDRLYNSCIKPLL